jgi:hypothetical protein
LEEVAAGQRAFRKRLRDKTQRRSRLPESEQLSTLAFRGIRHSPAVRSAEPPFVILVSTVHPNRFRDRFPQKSA